MMDCDLCIYEIETLRLGRELASIRAIASTQADDSALWCAPVTIIEAHLQRELRRLHAAVEGEV